MSTEGSDRVVVLLDRQLRTAIARRQLIRFKYGATVRVAEPHAYGMQHRFVRLLVYQRRAMPFSRGWRMLDVSKTGQLELRRDVRGQPPRGARASLPVG